MSTNRKYHRGASRPSIKPSDMTPGAIRMLTPEQYREEVLGLPPVPPAPRHWPKLVAAALVIGFALGYCTPAPADPVWCGPYRCTAWDRQHDRRAELRRLESERDYRDALRQEQDQWRRTEDQMERALGSRRVEIITLPLDKHR